MVIASFQRFRTIPNSNRHKKRVWPLWRDQLHRSFHLLLYYSMNWHELRLHVDYGFASQCWRKSFSIDYCKWVECEQCTPYRHARGVCKFVYSNGTYTVFERGSVIYLAFKLPNLRFADCGTSSTPCSQPHHTASHAIMEWNTVLPIFISQNQWNEKAAAAAASAVRCRCHITATTLRISIEHFFCFVSFVRLLVFTWFYVMRFWFMPACTAIRNNNF